MSPKKSLSTNFDPLKKVASIYVCLVIRISSFCMDTIQSIKVLKYKIVISDVSAGVDLSDTSGSTGRMLFKN